LTGLVSTGFCGGLDASLQPCDIFVASEVAGPDLRFPAKTPGFDGSAGIKSGVLLSVDRVASDAREKSELRRCGAAAVEMEAAGVASKAMEWNIPFFCVRVVTDTADESLPLDFNRLRDEEGRFSRSRIIGAALRRPVVFPELMRLDSRTKKAARVLGDFVASCRF
jgi:nucleoside phosphorylase